MSKLIALPTTTNELQGKLNFVISEIQELYSIYLALSQVTANPYVRGVLPTRLEQSTKQDLLTNLEKHTSIWEQSVNVYTTSLEENETLSYEDVIQSLVDLGEIYNVQYGFSLGDGSNLDFTITLPNSTEPVFTKSVSNLTSVSELLTFMSPYLLQLPYHVSLAQILTWSTHFKLENKTVNRLSSVIIQDTKTGATVKISNSGSLCSFKAKTSFCGESEHLSVETSQGYLLSWNGLALTKPVHVSKVENNVPLPCLARKVIDILGELPVYAEKTSQGRLWTYK